MIGQGSEWLIKIKKEGREDEEDSILSRRAVGVGSVCGNASTGVVNGKGIGQKSLQEQHAEDFSA